MTLVVCKGLYSAAEMGKFLVQKKDVVYNILFVSAIVL
jgi:hypothetical protein